MSELPHVVIADFLCDRLEPENKVLGDVARLTALRAHSEDELFGLVEEVDAIILYHEVSITRRTIERLRRCRLIVRGGVGIDNVDLATAREHGIPVANVPDYGSEEVADSAVGMALALTRGFHFMNSRLRNSQLRNSQLRNSQLREANRGTDESGTDESGTGKSGKAGEDRVGQAGPAATRGIGQGDAWSYSLVAPLVRLRGNTFAVVGLGRIGTAVALRAKALGMDVAFYDPYKPDGYEKSLGIRRVETLDALLAQSLVVSLHCPLTDETHNMIDAAAIGRMPRGSYLINTSRGGVVDVAALPDALASGHLAGAAIDVLPQEPPPPEHPLLVAWRDPNHPAHHRLILNPHAAFYSEEGLLDIRVKTAEACRRAVLGMELRNVVN